MWPSRASIVLPYNLFALIIANVGTSRSALLPGASDPVFDDPTQFRGTLCAIAPNTTRVWQKLRMLATFRLKIRNRAQSRAGVSGENIVQAGDLRGDVFEGGKDSGRLFRRENLTVREFARPSGYRYG